MTDALDARLVDLQTRIAGLGSVVVAFSAGADSAFLLAAAARSLGPHAVVAATSVSPALATGEWDSAARSAGDLGVRHERVDTAELLRPGYVANGPDRCFHCKAELLDRLLELAAELGLAHVATGTNAEDVRAPHRPGLAAAAERGVVTPLADAGFTKPGVREASRRWGLPRWDKPQAACLASRIAYGTAVDTSRLARVDRAEAAARAALARAGIAVTNLRVRDLGDPPGGAAARLEVDATAVAAVHRAPEVLAAIRAAGFATAHVEVFRSGAMNEALEPQGRSPLLRGAEVLPVVD